MATVDPYIGRRDAVGLGIENPATPGTAVPPQIWLRWLSNELQPKTTVIENESAIGVVDKVNDSEVVAKWTEGNIGGKVTSESIGFLLLGLMGSVSSTGPVSSIYTHTFSNKQSALATCLTLARSTPFGGTRSPYAVIDSLEFSVEKGGWLEVTAAIKARVSAPSTETVAIPTTEAEFTSKHVTVKTAANVAGLAGATAIQALSTKIKLERDTDPFFPLGVDDAPIFDKQEFMASGEFVVRLTDDQYSTDFLANTIKALSITIANGTQSLVFTGSRVRYRELEVSRDKDAVVTATVSFSCEFDTATNASIVPVLKNGRSGYVNA